MGKQSLGECQPCRERGRMGMRAFRNVEGTLMCRACFVGRGDEFWKRKSVRRQRLTWYARNRERALAACRAWQRTHPEIVRESCRRWAQSHASEVQAYKRAYRARRHEYILAYLKKWRVKNRNRVLAYNRAYAARVRAQDRKL